MRKSVLALLPALALLASGACTTEDNTGGSEAGKDGKWFGFAVDAKTGADLNFFTEVNATTGVDENDKSNSKSTNQVWALVDAKVKTAKPCDQGDANTDNGISRAGCFQIDGLPTGVNIPVFADHSGYHSFAGVILLDPTVLLITDGDHDLEDPVFADKPSLYANVRLFPTGISYDYTITTTFTNRGVEGVVVRCVLDATANAFDIVGDGGAGNFLAPSNSFNPIVSGTTDSKGQVTFAGSTLTKGARYTCSGHGTDLITGAVYSNDAGLVFVVGIADPNQEMVMTVNNSGLTSIWNNYQDPNTPLGSLDGPMTIVLNRPASITAGTTDCQASTVAIGNPSTASPNITAIVADVDDDDAESVSVSIDATGTTITAATLYGQKDTADTQVFGTIGGIYLNPQSGEDAGQIYSINADFSAPGAGAGFSITNSGLTCDIASIGAIDTPLVDELTGVALTFTARLL